MPENPTIGVIIATRDQPRHVLEAVASVREQTVAPDEIIVVDDGSTDDTLEHLRALGGPITVIGQEPRGQSIARNTGIAACRADWICFLDHDDLWHRAKLETLRRFLADHPGCQAVNHPVWFFSAPDEGATSHFGYPRDFVATDLDDCHREAEERSGGDPALRAEDILGRSYAALLAHNVAMPSAVAARRDLIIRAGCFPPGHSEDWRLFRNMARLSEWHTLPERLSFARLHARQATHVEVTSVYRLVALIDTWYGGRVHPDRASDAEDDRQWLASYGPVYRDMVQEGIWRAVRGREWALAGLNHRLGGALLPRRRDRLYALLPRRVTASLPSSARASTAR